MSAKTGRNKSKKNKSEEQYRADYLAIEKDADNFLDLVCADITEFKTAEGKLYLSGCIDVATRMLVSHKISTDMKQHIVQEPIIDIVKRYGTPKMYHCDRGSQYVAIKTKELLDSYGITISMSMPHTPNNNQIIESFWSTLKREMESICKMTRNEAKETIELYIYFYNTIRLHSSIGYETPIDKKRLLTASSEE